MKKQRLSKNDQVLLTLDPQKLYFLLILPIIDKASDIQVAVERMAVYS